jgi:hypothetical protein
MPLGLLTNRPNFTSIYIGSVTKFSKELLLPTIPFLSVISIDRHAIIIRPDKGSISTELLGKLLKIYVGPAKCSFETVIEIAPINKDSNPLHFLLPPKISRGIKKSFLIPLS